jgi:hypothetical protein
VDKLFASHADWKRFDQLSPEFDAMIPADEGMDIGVLLGGSKRILDSPEVFKHGVADNKAKTISGDIRFVRKADGVDVLKTFIELARRESRDKTYYAEMKEGDSSKGVYLLVYKNKAGLVVYEKINNDYATAVSYRLMVKDGAPEEDAVSTMVAHFTLVPKLNEQCKIPQ